MLPWLPAQPILFPPLDTALDEPDGLLAAGGALAPDWLLAAYRRGIFPWFAEDQPILWWSPDPRLVLFPDQLRITRSLAKRLRNGGFHATCDNDFAAVIEACATIRANTQGTWITASMQASYHRLYQLGHAHSIEIWRNERLVGGLYGVALGRMFFGESMFSLERDASKVALVHLARHLRMQGGGLIDCQMTTPHLVSLGARSIARSEFIDYLNEYVDQPAPSWDLASPPRDPGDHLREQ